ncbi:exonuclease V subunit alpha [compost metagenome]
MLQRYNKALEGNQILCATSQAAVSVKTIDALCQQHLNGDGEALLLMDQEFDPLQGISMCAGVPVICLKNHRQVDLQNGSLSKTLLAEPLVRDPALGRLFGRILCDDGLTRDLTADLLSLLTLIYVITIHKAQGNCFRRAIIPERQSRLLDRPLLYTTVTRAVVRVPHHAEQRHIALGSLLGRRLRVGP